VVSIAAANELGDATRVRNGTVFCNHDHGLEDAREARIGGSMELAKRAHMDLE